MIKNIEIKKTQEIRFFKTLKSANIIKKIEIKKAKDKKDTCGPKEIKKNCAQKLYQVITLIIGEQPKMLEIEDPSLLFK